MKGELHQVEIEESKGREIKKAKDKEEYEQKTNKRPEKNEKRIKLG